MKIHISPGPCYYINTPCDCRAEIYRYYLDDAYRVLFRLGDFEVEEIQSDFQKLIVHNPSLHSDRIMPALNRQLLEELAAILDEYVMVGIAADLLRCRPQLYDHPPAITPNLYDLIISKPNNNMPDETKSLQTTKQAYQNYFDWFINRIVFQKTVARGPLERKSGVQAFYERYPMVKNAVAKVTRNFITNVVEACTRIHNNWDIVSNIFFPPLEPSRVSVLQRLQTIKSSGSDFHKGGKQVLFLTFTCRDRDPVRLVYKPADVEMDYRLVGNTEGIRGNPGLNNLGNLQSLTEIINESFAGRTFGLDRAFCLPTYRILPFSPGSTLDGDPLPIGNSYGYIEFLGHNPEIDNETGAPEAYVPGQPSDWVAESISDVRRFYRQWGCLLAILPVFSISDMHRDNMVVHKLQPHLIDLEISFKCPMNSVSATYAQFQIGKDGEVWAVVRRAYRNDRTANLKVLNYGEGGRNKAYFTKLWLYRAGVCERTDPEDYLYDLYDSYCQTVRILQNDPGGKIVHWLNNVNKVVARFTPYGTSKFIACLRTIYSTEYCSDIIPQLPSDFNRQPFLLFQSKALQPFSPPNRAEDGVGAWPKPSLNYAIQTPENSFLDYINCDVPAFYHRLGDCDLLNARGGKVLIPIINPIITREPEYRFPNPIPRENYFPEPTFDIVCFQFLDLRNTMLSSLIEGLRTSISIKDGLHTHILNLLD